MSVCVCLCIRVRIDSQPFNILSFTKLKLLVSCYSYEFALKLMSMFLETEFCYITCFFVKIVQIFEFLIFFCSFDLIWIAIWPKWKSESSDPIEHNINFVRHKSNDKFALNIWNLIFWSVFLKTDIFLFFRRFVTKIQIQMWANFCSLDISI